MNYEELARLMRREMAAKQRIMAIASRVFGALDAQEMGESAESSRALAAKMLANLGIVSDSSDDISVQLLDAYTAGWNAAFSNQGRPFAGPARAPAPLPPGVRVQSKNYKLLGEPGFSPGTQGDGVRGGATDSAGEDFMTKYLRSE